MFNAKIYLEFFFTCLWTKQLLRSDFPKSSGYNASQNALPSQHVAVSTPKQP